MPLKKADIKLLAMPSQMAMQGVIQTVEIFEVLCNISFYIAFKQFQPKNSNHENILSRLLFLA